MGFEAGSSCARAGKWPATNGRFRESPPDDLETILVVLGVGSLGAAAASANPEVALLKVFKGLIPGGGVADKIIGFAMVWTALIAMALLIAGVLHAYILPLMPFILFTFAVMDMLVMTICGVIAAPVWAMMHINLEGEEMFKGRHGAGYMVCFNILLRPVLTLFGLFLSMHLFEAMIWLLSVTIYPALGTATAGHFFGVIGTITYVILITVLNYQVAVRSFHLIIQVPQRVSSWFGASADGDGGEQHSTKALGLVVSSAEKGLNTMQGAGKGAGAAGAAAGGAALPGKAIAKGAGKVGGAVSEAALATGSKGRGGTD